MAFVVCMDKHKELLITNIKIQGTMNKRLGRVLVKREGVKNFQMLKFLHLFLGTEPVLVAWHNSNVLLGVVAGITRH